MKQICWIFKFWTLISNLIMAIYFTVITYEKTDTL